MPIRKQDYDPNWSEISLSVRTEADWKCEWCMAPGGQVIRRGRGADWKTVTATGEEATAEMKWPRLKFHGLTRVILSVSHLDRNSKNNQRGNLAALCQRCHLRHDIHQHIANRRYGRHHAKEQQLKLKL